MNERAKVILRFWFQESTSKEHFNRSDEFDQKIRNLFKNDYQNAIQNKLEDWQDNHKTCLALVILLDQFSRNLFRDSPLAYANDKKTRLIVNEAIDRGDLEKLNDSEKFFLILPLIHSEDISDHLFAHKLCDSFLKSHPEIEDIRKTFKHHTIPIKKFGRYPHRNKILGRKSTDEEEVFLTNPNTSW
tara:strand:- start:492 stop:1052 length:561 start_codon:yes stop_codon:yes gene_type:complete